MNKNEKMVTIPFLTMTFVYLTELYYYLFGYSSGVQFVTSLFFMSILLFIFTFLIKKTNIPKRAFVIPTLLSLLLLAYELPTILIDDVQYLVTSYSEPEEVIDETGIFILSINLAQVTNVKNEQEVREMFTYNGVEFFYEIIETTNFKRYTSKNKEIFRLLGLNRRDFDKMAEYVSTYINTNNPSVVEFLSREDSSGDSAGLALVLSGMIHQGDIQNNLPIGVTGAITKTGKVQWVGAIKEKIQVANDHGYAHIIIPHANLAEANEVKEALGLNIPISGVKNINEAIKVIKNVNK